MAYLTETDYDKQIKSDLLAQIIGSDNTIREAALEAIRVAIENNVDARDVVDSKGNMMRHRRSNTAGRYTSNAHL